MLHFHVTLLLSFQKNHSTVFAESTEYMIWNYRDLPSIPEKLNFEINKGEIKSYSKSVSRVSKNIHAPTKTNKNYFRSLVQGVRNSLASSTSYES